MRNTHTGCFKKTFYLIQYNSDTYDLYKKRSKFKNLKNINVLEKKIYSSNIHEARRFLRYENFILFFSNKILGRSI